MNRKTKKHIIIIIVSLVCALIFGGIVVWKMSQPPETLNDLAYDINKRHGYTVYIKENDEYIPYLVLTNDYNGNGDALLLREHLLEESYFFNDRLGYYKDSYIDRYLAEVFLPQIAAEVRDIIVDSEITIAKRNRDRDRLTEQITRQVFLLSLTEVDFTPSIISAIEGISLEYFRGGAKTRIASFADGEASSWWLRSMNYAEDFAVYGIGPNGARGGEFIGAMAYARRSASHETRPYIEVC